MNSHKSLPEPNDVLYRIKRGISGYISYLAACEMNESFSEYILYEPILRVLTARGYDVKCEVECPGITQPPKGDKKKLDFVASKNNITVALEVKWAKKSKLQIENDLEKLVACQEKMKTWHLFLCIFGTKSCIEKIILPIELLQEQGDIVIAEFGRTRYGCRVYKLLEQGTKHDR